MLAPTPVKSQSITLVKKVGYDLHVNNDYCNNIDVSGTLNSEELDKHGPDTISIIMEEGKLGQAVSDRVVEPFIHIYLDPLDEQILKEKSAAYPRPANAETLKVPRLNRWLEEISTKEYKQQDGKLQKMQSYMIASMSAVAAQSQILLDLEEWATKSSQSVVSEKADTFGKAFASLMDISILMSKLMHDTNQFRRDLIMQGMTESVIGLIFDQNKATPEWLAGEDVGATIPLVTNSVGNKHNSTVNTKDKHSQIKSDQEDNLRVQGIQLMTSTQDRKADFQETPTVDGKSFDTLRYVSMRGKDNPLELPQYIKRFEDSSINLSVIPSHHKVLKTFAMSEAGMDNVLIEVKTLETNENMDISHTLESVVLGKDLKLTYLTNEEQKGSESDGAEEFILPSATNLDKSTAMGKELKPAGQNKDHMMNYTKEQFVCPECGKRLCRLSSLKLHMRKHRGEKPYLCSICGNSFSESGSLKRHGLVYHSGDKPHICTVCSRGFRNSEALMLHMDYHKRQNSYTCSECNKGFCSAGNLKKHLRIHTGEKTYMCVACGRRFIHLSGLKSHMLMHTLKKSYTCSVCEKGFSKRLSLTVHMATHRQENTHICFDCGQVFRKKTHLLSHIKKKHKQKKAGNTTKGSPKLDEITLPTEQTKLNSHICSKCGKGFNQLDSLMVHMTSHTGVPSNIHMDQAISKEFHVAEDEQLDSDGTVEYLPSSLEDDSMIDTSKKRHVDDILSSSPHFHKTKDTDQKPHVSTHPVKEFIQPEYSEVHRTAESENVFTEDKNSETKERLIPHDDEQSVVAKKNVKHLYLSEKEKENSEAAGDEKCTLASSPNVHKHRAMQGRPHVCSVCGKGFKQACHLREHMRIHTGEMPYKCPTCGRKFKQTGQLKYHIKTHMGELSRKKTPHVCSQCCKGFKHICHLRKHMRTHTGEIPYKCSKCDKGFKKAEQLKCHMTSHMGDPSNQERPHVCSECCKGFKQACHLREHMRTHTGETPYKCSKCGKGFKQTGQLKCHMRSHEGERSTQERPYVCSKCGKGFKQTRQLKCHMRSHKGEQSTQERPYVCSECCKGFKQASHLREHMRTHTGEKPYKCSECGKEFRQIGQLNYHMRTHWDQNQETAEVHFCAECGKRFSSLDALNTHMETHTGEMPHHDVEALMQSSSPDINRSKNTGTQAPIKTVFVEMIIEPSNAEVQKSTNLVERPHVCFGCGKRFKYATHLRVHMLMTHSVEKAHVCSKCGKGFNRLQNLRVHMMIHTGEKPFVCKECGKGYSLSSALKIHMRIHTGEQRPKEKLICSECGKSFVGSLQSHMRSHTGEKPFVCSVCSKPFSQAGNLKVHMLIHTGEKPHLCTHCGKSFRTVGNLDTHIRCHTGEKPYNCSYCGNAYSDSGTLKKHVRRHTGERPYVCDECGKKFICAAALTKHTMTHTGEKPYVCPDCDKGFASSGNLKKHIRTHTGERPYGCDVCSKGFNSPWHLREHVRTHTGEKPFVCSYCGKRFSDGGSLKKHNRTHTIETASEIP